MNNRQKMLLYIIAVLLLCVLFIFLSKWKEYRIVEEIEQKLLIPIGEINDIIPEDDVALSSHDTMADYEVSLQDFPDRIAIKNKSILADTSLPSYGYKTLEAYLTEYFDYYWDNGTNYYAEVVENSFQADYNLPSFKLYVEELNLEIECIWYSSRQVYHFFSKFNIEH